MPWIITKYLMTAGVVVLVSEFAKRSGRLGGLIAALPLVTLLALVWMHLEGEPEVRIAGVAKYTFWYVIPTLPMFLAFPALLPRMGFWAGLLVSVALTVVCFGAWAMLLRRFGIDLL